MPFGPYCLVLRWAYAPISKFGFDSETFALVLLVSLMYIVALGVSDYKLSPLHYCVGALLVVVHIRDGDVDLPTVELLSVFALLYVVVVGRIHDLALWHWTTTKRHQNSDLLDCGEWRDWLTYQKKMSGQITT